MRHDTALIARARGLLHHLVPRATLEALADCPDVAAFSRGISRLGLDVEPVGEPWDLAGFERAVRQTGARHLATLGRWQQAKASAIDVFNDDIDRRTIRRMIRGAMIGAPAAARLEGLMPTPRLPERVLTELAHQSSPSAVVGLLAVVGHPDALALAPLVSATQPELFAIERTLLAGWAERSVTLSRRDAVLRELVALRIDVGNAQTAILLASGPRDLDPVRVHVAGGRALTPAHFAAAAVAPTGGEALTILQRGLAGTALEPLLPTVPSDIDAIERSYLIHALDLLGRHARQDPMATATLLRTLLRIETQGRDLRTLAWGAALGTPPSRRKHALVTPWL